MSKLVNYNINVPNNLVEVNFTGPQYDNIHPINTFSTTTARKNLLMNVSLLRMARNANKLFSNRFQRRSMSR